MRIGIPKGSYHQYCKNKYASRSAQQTHRQRIIKHHEQEHQIRNFHNFESYIMFLQQKQQRDRERIKCQTERALRTADQSRPRTQIIARPIQRGDDKQQQKLIKPFFPFFKCKIESSTSPVRNSHFRINSRKLKLNHRIIQQNMGKVDQHPNW